MVQLLGSILLSIIPWAIRVHILRLIGMKIGKNVKIGWFVVIDSKNVDIGDNVQIASFNLIHRLCKLKMANGSRMNGLNWITGAKTGEFYLGKNSAITRLHFFEASAGIEIGDNTIVAGRNSHFFTHGISSTNLDDMRPIKIGPWCYIGSSSRFVPGAEISKGTFVGLGAVVTKRFDEPYILLGGIPAEKRKKLSPDDIFFSRSHLTHDHHPSWYAGG